MHFLKHFTVWGLCAVMLGTQPALIHAAAPSGDTETYTASESSTTKQESKSDASTEDPKKEDQNDSSTSSSSEESDEETSSSEENKHDRTHLLPRIREIRRVPEIRTIPVPLRQTKTLTKGRIPVLRRRQTIPILRTARNLTLQPQNKIIQKKILPRKKIPTGKVRPQSLPKLQRKPQKQLPRRPLLLKVRKIRSTPKKTVLLPKPPIQSPTLPRRTAVVPKRQNRLFLKKKS